MAGYTIEGPPTVSPSSSSAPITVAGGSYTIEAPTAAPPTRQGFGNYLAESLEALGEGVRQLPGEAVAAGKEAAGLAGRIVTPGFLQPQAMAPGQEGPLEGLGIFATGGLMNPLAPEVGAVGRAASTLPEEAATAKSALSMPKVNTAVTPLERRAREIVAKRFAEDAKSGGLSAANALEDISEARREHQPMALADIGGRGVRRLAGTVYRSPGGSAEIMRNFFQGRDQDFVDATLDTAAGARIASAVDKYVATGSMRQTAKALSAARSEHAKPLWDAAMSQKPVWSERLQQFLEFPDFQKGLRLGWMNERRAALEEGRAVNPGDYAITGFNEAGDPIIGRVPTMKLIQMAKEGVDHLLEDPSLHDPLTGNLTKTGRAIFGEQKSFLSEVDRLNPSYAAARDQWAGDTANMRALRDGRDIFSRRMSPEELREEFPQLTQSEQEFYRLGAADKLKEDLENTRISGDESKAIVNSSADMKKLRVLFGDQKQFDRFVANIRRERTMFEAARDIMSGSQTAERGAEDARVGAAMHGIHGATHLATGNPVRAAMSFYRAKRDLGLRSNPALNEEIARTLTNPSIAISVTQPSGKVNLGIEDFLGHLPP